MGNQTRRLVEQRMTLSRELAAAEEALKHHVIEEHGQYRVGDVAEHNYHGGGTFEVDDVECRIVFIEAGARFSSDRAVANVYYHGYAHKLGGGVGKRRVTHFGERIVLADGGTQ